MTTPSERDRIQVFRNIPSLSSLTERNRVRIRGGRGEDSEKLPVHQMEDGLSEKLIDPSAGCEVSEKPKPTNCEPDSSATIRRVGGLPGDDRSRWRARR